MLTVTGPRQSGKTTLCRQAFPSLRYISLESPREREFAAADPDGFVASLTQGAILDEVQRAPQLLSSVQVLVDEKGRNGMFVLTGSQQFGLTTRISQSLAGRAASLALLPFNLAERQRAGADTGTDSVLHSGFYPRIHAQGIDPRRVLDNYYDTYVERDVRQVANIRNTSRFRHFVRLCAGRVGQLLNLSSLGADAGVSHTTARDWLSALEASYLVFLLPPFHANIRKRLVKSPKLYFYDVGLASHLIGIEHPGQLATHPLRGPLFENLVVAEALKHRYNRGLRSNLSFFRDASGLEVDLLYDVGGKVRAIEIKSGPRVASDAFASLAAIDRLVPGVSSRVVVYGGERRQSRAIGNAIPLSELDGELDLADGGGQQSEGQAGGRWRVSFTHPDGDASAEATFPHFAPSYPDTATARRAAVRVLAVLAEEHGDRRQWQATGRLDLDRGEGGARPSEAFVVNAADARRERASSVPWAQRVQ